MINGLAERLQKQRMLLKLSQKEVAVAIGVSPSVISNYESGSREPSLEVLKAIAKLYHCSTDYLLGIEKAGGVDIDSGRLTAEQKHLLQLFIDSLD